MPKPGPGYKEFITMTAVIISITALSIDIMLPALPDIGRDLAVSHPNTVQLIISVLILGMGIGQLLFGPISDCFGRKPAISSGFAVFIIGCLLSLFSKHFEVMLIGRLIQGIGAAGPRTAIVALIRDKYDGRGMARIMSAVMAVFIFVPAIAPALGQFVLLHTGWRAIFSILVIQGALTVFWFNLRQPETLTLKNRIPFSVNRILGGLKDVCTTRLTLGYTLAAGFMSGALLSYLNCAQQIYQEIYGLGREFPLYMAVIALSLGCASLINSRIVMRFGMRALSFRAIFLFTLIITAYFGATLFMDGNPPFFIFMLSFSLSFFCLGILFGNMNAIAMEPMGHIAGMGAAVIGSLTSLIASPISALIGQFYNDTTLPLAGGTLILCIATAFAMRWADR